MEISALAQLWANQMSSSQSSGSSGGLFAALLSTALLNGAASESSVDTDLLSSVIGGVLDNGESDDTKDGLSSAMLVLCMLGIGGNASGSGYYAMMSSLSGALGGEIDYSPTTISTVNSRTSAQAYGIWNTSANPYNGTYVYNPKASTSIPLSASVACNPSITSSAGNRSAAAYRQVIDQFDVESNTRYTPKNGGTYCNIFLWDVTRAMGAEIPHYIDPDTWEARYYPDTGGATQMTANRIYDWLGKKGSEYGWYEVSAQQAQELANQGHPVVTAYKNSSGHGHVQVVCPSKDGTYNAKKGVTIAQAGSHLYDYAYISDVFSSRGLSKVKYYAHA